MMLFTRCLKTAKVSAGAVDKPSVNFGDVPEGLLSLQLDLRHLTVVGALNLDG
jgi:hypothetical protein